MRNCNLICSYVHIIFETNTKLRKYHRNSEIRLVDMQTNLQLKLALACQMRLYQCQFYMQWAYCVRAEARPTGSGCCSVGCITTKNLIIN